MSIFIYLTITLLLTGIFVKVMTSSCKNSDKSYKKKFILTFRLINSLLVVNQNHWQLCEYCWNLSLTYPGFFLNMGGEEHQHLLIGKAIKTKYTSKNERQEKQEYTKIFYNFGRLTSAQFWNKAVINPPLNLILIWFTVESPVRKPDWNFVKGFVMIKLKKSTWKCTSPC